MPGSCTRISWPCASAAGPSMQDEAFLLAPVSLLWPFLTHEGQARYNNLRPSEALAEGTGVHAVLTHSDQLVTLPARLLGSFRCQGAAEALQDAIQAVQRSGQEGVWSLNWALSPLSQLPAAPPVHPETKPPPTAVGPFSGAVAFAAASASLAPPPGAQAAFALLSISLIDFPGGGSSLGLPPEGESGSPATGPSPRVYPGMPLRILGSPFGCLSPSLFSNCTITGCISLLLLSRPQRSATTTTTTSGGARPPPLCMVDAACFPGMEGSLVLSAAPVPGQQEAPVGMLCRPLTRQPDGVQVQLVVGWHEVEEGLGGLLRRLKLGGPAGGAAVTRQLTASALESSISPSTCSSSSTSTSTVHSSAPSLVRSGASASLPTSHWPLASPSSALPTDHPLERSLAGVCLIRTRSSWSTGVLVSHSGAIITNAHLLAPPASPTTPSDPQSSPRPPEWCEVRLPRTCCLNSSTSSSLPAASSSSSSSSSSYGLQPEGFVWARARVLFLFTNHLDLAVLQLDAESLSRLRLFPITLRDPPTPSCSPRPGFGKAEGLGVVVVGHGLFGPGAAWPAAATHGNVCKVVRASGRPCMLLTTAAVHSGASGAAVLDSADGRLVGLVTSNARFGDPKPSSGGAGGGATLPRFNFAISGEELREVVEFCRDRLPRPTLGGPDAAAVQRAAEALRAMDRGDERATR